MHRKPHEPGSVFVVPLPGFEIVYLTRTEEIISMVRPEPDAQLGDVESTDSTRVQSRKKSS